MTIKEVEIVELTEQALRENDVELLMDISEILAILASVNRKLYQIKDALKVKNN